MNNSNSNSSRGSNIIVRTSVDRARGSSSNDREALLRYSSFGGAEGTPILFSKIVFCMASCSYIYISDVTVVTSI